MGIRQRIIDGTVVGAFVYEAYTPSRCGVVIRDLGPIGNGYFHKLEIKYRKGEIKVRDSGQVNDYEELIADHKRKYDNHLSVLEQLRKMRSQEIPP